MGMSFEERIDKLTERHEALTQSVELMVHENQQREKQFAEMQAVYDKRFGAMLIRIEEMGAKTDKRLEVLLKITESHEHRLTRLEEK